MLIALVQLSAVRSRVRYCFASLHVSRVLNLAQPPVEACKCQAKAASARI